MTFRIINTLKQETMAEVISHLNNNLQRLTPDKSTYSPGRQKYWLQSEWDLKDRIFRPAVKDERLWTFCKRAMPEADLGLVVYGEIGIKPHRDDSYADWRGVGINLGEMESWYYDAQYPELKWTKETNPSAPRNIKVLPGQVFEFNTKNPHGANNPAHDRWAIFLWKIKQQYRSQRATTKRTITL